MILDPPSSFIPHHLVATNQIPIAASYKISSSFMTHHLHLCFIYILLFSCDSTYSFSNIYVSRPGNFINSRKIAVTSSASASFSYNKGRLFSTFSTSSNEVSIGKRLNFDETYAGLEKVYSDPDIFIIQDFLDKESCQDLIKKAQAKKLDLSPVAYAGKADDRNELISLAAKGPVAWLSIVSAWFQFQQGGGNGEAGNNLIPFGINVLTNYGIILLLAVVSITAFIQFRADGLQELRTSTSTTLDDLDDPKSGTCKYT